MNIFKRTGIHLKAAKARRKLKKLKYLPSDSQRLYKAIRKSDLLRNSKRGNFRK